ncbi:MAG: SusC/RagA family TonB-linked outer membrane protein [Cyclobacteriaceae bacterium]
MRKFLLISALVLFWSATVFGQTRVVTGQVRSDEDNGPLPGANVVVQGTAKGTVTDLDGRYSLELGASETVLVFSFIGYETQTITVGDRSVIDVVLQPDTKALEEIVVIGYGTVRKSDLTGAVSSVKSDDIIKIPTSTPALSLQGKVTGVQVAPTSGQPGAGAYVRIRGIGTFNDASPIYVVDGVILNDINFLNAADIQSMEVLKDASATAIYGSRGANGVIIVTTKKGKAGQEFPTISVNADYSMQYLPKKISLLNGKEFATVVNAINPGSFNNVDAVPDTDWQDLIFRSAPIHNYQVSAAGATARSDYYIGLGYFGQEGIIDKSKFERVTLKFNNTYHLSNKIRFGNNLTIVPSKSQFTNGNAVFVVYRAQPTITPLQPDGSYSVVPGVGNVLADIENTNSFGNELRSVGNLYGEVDVAKGITFKSSLGVDFVYAKGRSFTPVFFVSPQQQNATSDLNKSYRDFTSWIWENTVNLRKEFGNHRVDGVAGYTMQAITSEEFRGTGQNIIRDDENYWYLNSANINPSSVATSINDYNSLISYLFRANYTYNDRYLFTFTFRRDGSSKFTSTNRYADFPSFALGWNVINEDFMDALPLFSNLKVRASYGTLGNEKIPYLRQYSLVSTNDVAVFGSNEAIYNGSTYDVAGNPNLKWETTYQTDVGLELGFLNDRLTAELDYYHRRTEGILIDLPVPGYLGNGDGAAITFNAAEVVNKGFEYHVSYSGELGAIKYRIGTLGTTVNNEATVVQGFGGPGDYVSNGAGTTRTAPGLPLGAFFGYQVDGIFQNQSELNAYPHRSDAGIGDLRYVDVDNNGVINGDDRTYLGSPIPTFIYGMNLEAGYKAFDLSADFTGQSGNKIFNNKETIRPDLYNFEKRYLDYWRGDGTSNSEPRPTAGGYNFLPSSRFIQDGSYFRLRSITLGYMLPQALVSKANVKSMRVFLRGTNVFTSAKFTGYTPEIVSGSPINNGIDSGTYPVPAMISGGVNITF